MWSSRIIRSLLLVGIVSVQAVAVDILFISSMDPTHMPGDDALKAYMEGLGYTVEYLDDDASQADTRAAAEQASLVFISESCSSQRIRNEITDVPVPMIITEAWAWDEMGLTKGTGGGQDAASTDIEIVAPGHPLAAGLSGKVTVLTATSGTRGNARFGMGQVGSQATVIARGKCTDGLTYDVIFMYPKGAALPAAPQDGSQPIAAEARVCFGLDEQSYLLWNDNAYALLGAAIKFLLGLRPDPRAAKQPDPADGAVDVPTDVVLSWQPGPFAAGHDVYLGSSFEDVNLASRTEPKGVLVSQGQSQNRFETKGLLGFDTTYYWRVDPVNSLVDPPVIRGPVWSFTTEPYAYPLKGMIVATASGSLSADCGPAKTVDGSGLDARDRHDIALDTMWLSNSTPAWIQYDLGKPYKLDRILIWNSNSSLEEAMGFGARDVDVEASLDGSGWGLIAKVEVPQAPGQPDYGPGLAVGLGGVVARYVRLTINSNWAGGALSCGLSEVRFYYVPLEAYGPEPADGATGVSLDAILNWRPGRQAVSHRVYIGTDLDAVRDGQVEPRMLADHHLDLGSIRPDYATRYYWRVDEVNQADIMPVVVGPVWSFTTIDHLVVDDFELYDDDCHRIFFAWEDGLGHSGSQACGVPAFGGNGSGSAVGNMQPPFAERALVYLGSQSMPLEYDNTKAPYYSETQRGFEPAADWGKGGLETLTLFVRHASPTGQPSSESIYMVVEDRSGRRFTVSSPDLLARAEGRWVQWDIALSQIKAAGVDVGQVVRLVIGVGNRALPTVGSSGKVYIDHIIVSRQVSP